MSSDPLFQGMTRPAMLAGVTYSGVILNLMLVITPFVLLNRLWPLLAAIPIHGVMWLVCKWDSRFFDLGLVWMQTGANARHRYLWKGSTYRP
jgi:type IV secretion system protein VirB3